MFQIWFIYPKKNAFSMQQEIRFFINFITWNNCKLVQHKFLIVYEFGLFGVFFSFSLHAWHSEKLHKINLKWSCSREEVVNDKTTDDWEIRGSQIVWSSQPFSFFVLVKQFIIQNWICTSQGHKETLFCGRQKCKQLRFWSFFKNILNSP